MECSESILCSAGELELDPDIVSEEAGKLYSELQTVIETHGAGVVESLVPILVWVLEGLASCRAQLRESQEEGEKGRVEREELMERYQSEKSLRRESQERYHELDDQSEQERRAMRAREKEREKRERDLERKAREQADQLVALEEQKVSVARELSSLKNTHNKLALAFRELQEKKKDSERETLSRNHGHARSSETQTAPLQADNSVDDKAISRSRGHSDCPPLREPAAPGVNVIDIERMPSPDPSFINDIISSTPELSQLQDLLDGSAPSHTVVSGAGPRTSLEEEMMEAMVNEEEEHRIEEAVLGKDNQDKMVQKEDEGEIEEEEEEDSLEQELRNTDSVFSELSELSRDYVDSVDHGASVRGSVDQLEEILSQFEELKHTHELVDAARKALISRVEELTNDRLAVKLELTSSQETASHLESRMKEMEQEAKRLRKELETCQSEDPDGALPTSMRRFSRSEMARVVMEKNQYKERLFELQEAVRRSQVLRATKDVRITEERQRSVWGRFHRLFGRPREPFVLAAAQGFAQATSPVLSRSPLRSPQLQTVNQTRTELIHDGHSSSPVSPAALSPRVRKRELYREVRSHIWGTLGKRQLNGWSVPLSHTQESMESTPEPKDVPALLQLRMLDQRDPSAKLNCAVAVTAEISGEAACSVWLMSGLGSSSEVTVIDPARSNTVLDQFSLPPTSPALCICAVPPTGNTSGTVWIGTQEGSVLVHSASTGRRRCMQSISLSEGVHSLTYSSNQVIAGLADGALAFFSHNGGGWDLPSHQVMNLGTTPLQPLRCCLAKGGRLWVGYWNRVHVVDIESKKAEQNFSVSERSEQQVRFLCAAGSGVWTSCRLDPLLRLFDWSSGRPLQEVDLTPLVTKTLGQAFLSISPLQISALAIISSCLWLGTGSGAIFSIPLTITSELLSIPYCSLAAAQLCYHGHRQAVKFFIVAPNCLTTSTGGDSCAPSQFILSGGEGYINFRIGDDASDGSTELPQTTLSRSERSHMIIWQSPTPSVPSSAL
ncbi:C-Jun-amino-terminal kinase-interacting protein 3 isoform X1 [Gadus morhua]|uniref:C-Jun-amino-terminal kinase-interacting protein 3 isoform X1 n=1 Tax=Gadus morhua TaxID=8049 RepID=UPI0011B5B991|nr:C-Jun-amino-terminal kinase-interacting protein 3-like isoform X1 [Gadus morhua]